MYYVCAVWADVMCAPAPSSPPPLPPSLCRFAPVRARVAAFRDTVVPALTAGYRGGFVLSHMDLYPKNVLVDARAASTSRVYRALFPGGDAPC